MDAGAPLGHDYSFRAQPYVPVLPGTLRLMEASVARRHAAAPPIVQDVLISRSPRPGHRSLREWRKASGRVPFL